MNPFRLATPLTLITGALILLTGMSTLASGQTSAAKWQRIAPDGEEFTVLMPRAPEVQTDKKLFGQITVTSISYIIASEDGPFYMIASISGMETFSAMMPEKERLNSYAEGFWKGFFQSIREKGLKAEATRQRDLSLNGNPGAAYDVVMGDITGLAHVYSTKKKFYVVMVLNSPKGDSRTDQFLDSFTLGKVNGATGASDTTPRL